MNNKIIKAIYEAWIDGELGQKPSSPETDIAIDNIAQYFISSPKDALFIESQINNAAVTREKNAFISGFITCLELMHGKF